MIAGNRYQMPYEIMSLLCMKTKVSKQLEFASN